MAGTEMLACTISKYAWKMVKAGKATLEKGGVKDLGGQFIELAKPIVTDTAKKSTFASLNPAISAFNAASSLANNVQSEIIRQGVSLANMKLDTVINQLGKMSHALQGLRQIQVLSWVNTAFGLANCGISIAGFQMTLKKLDGINGQIHEFYERYRIDRQSDKVEAFHKIYLDLKNDLSVLQEMRTGKLGIKDLRQWEPSIVQHLNEADSFLKSVIMDFQDRRIDGYIGCQIIFTLSALYAQVMNEYCCWYYYAHEKQQALFADWFSLLDDIDSTTFRLALKNHLTIDLKYVDVLPSRKVDAYELAFGSIQEEKKLLVNGTNIVKQMNAEEYRDVESRINRETINTIIEQLPGVDSKSFDEALNRSILFDECIVDDESEQVIIPFQTQYPIATERT